MIRKERCCVCNGKGSVCEHPMIKDVEDCDCPLKDKCEIIDCRFLAKCEKCNGTGEQLEEWVFEKAANGWI
jgi:hypothetical protein